MYPRERPGTLCTEGWVGPRIGLDGCIISLLHRDSIPVQSIPLRVAVPTRLPRPTLVSQDLIIEASRSQTTFGRTPLEERSARRRDLYLTTHNTHNRQNPNASGRIRTHNPSKWAAVDPRLRPRGYFQFNIILPIIPRTTKVLSDYG